MSAIDSIRKTPSQTEIADTLSTLKLSTTVPQKPLHKPKSKPVADSWDLESSGSDTETETTAPLSATSTATTLVDDPPQPPPPTPASPTPFDFPDNSPYGAGRLRGGQRSGVWRTEEEREYDRAMREKERKRRAEEKEREKKETEEREARKKAMWDD
ncbi:hypothetical protein N0V86_004867 [Didymella sp. IMI 355093]|nr:hypothetical protein N0V86_004867 [Didymella sp. IMI 355093]